MLAQTMSSNRTRYGIKIISLGLDNKHKLPLEIDWRPTARSLPYTPTEGVDMKSNYFKNIAGTVVMAFSLILGISSITAAQWRDPYQNDRYRRQQEELRRQQAEQLRRQQDQWGRDQWGQRNRGRSGDGYPNWGNNYELRQTALNAGYNEGVRQGRNDRNRSRGYGYGYGNDFRNSSSYRNATKDYNSRYGDRELYRRYFQMAFENGYADGLRGY